MVDWAGLAKRKYDILEKKAEAARMRARAEMRTAKTGETEAERRFGPGGLREEELARRFPHGIPARAAETARIGAVGYAGAAMKGAKTAAERLELERKVHEFEKESLRKRPSGGKAVEEIMGIVAGKGAATPGVSQCPKGYYWDGTKCIPDITSKPAESRRRRFDSGLVTEGY